MEGLVVIKTDEHISPEVLEAVVSLTGSTVVILPLSCTITTKEAALKELHNYKDILERFLGD